MTAKFSGGVPSSRAIASRLDLLRSTGPRHAWRRLRQDRALRTVVQERRERVAKALWADAARQLGASFTELEPGLFEIRCGTATTTVKGATAALNAGRSVAFAESKPAVYKELAVAGLPVPEHLAFEVRDVRYARSFLVRGPVPCVVKPAQGRGGDGVTGEIQRASELWRAVLAASRFHSELLIERQVAGDVYRLLILDGQVLDVLHRLRPRVTGDGRSTIEELVMAEYDRRIRGDGDPGLKPFAVDLDCILTLKRAGSSLRIAPTGGSTVMVKSVTNYNRPEENRSLGTAVSEELKCEAATAAGVLGLRLAGVDVVARTPLASLADSAGAIVDVNAAPALHHHAHVADARMATSVAVPILRALLESPSQASSTVVSDP